jgi:hypothetical protein
VIAIQQKATDDYGVYTTMQTKMQYALQMRACIQRGSIVFYNQFVTMDTPGHIPQHVSELRLKVMRKCEEQLRRYRLVATNMEGRDAHTQQRYTVNGCTDEDGKIQTTLNDDLAVVFSIGIYWMEMTRIKQVPNMSFDYLETGFSIGV